MIEEDEVTKGHAWSSRHMRVQGLSPVELPPHAMAASLANGAALTPTAPAPVSTLAAPPASHRRLRRCSSPEPRGAFGQRSSDEASADAGGKAVLPPAHVLAGSAGLALRPVRLDRRWWAGLGADQGLQ